MTVNSNAATIRSAVDQYRLEVNGVRFWAPYWVNDPKLMGDAGAPNLRGAFKGKGTPEQLALSVKRLLAKSSRRPQSAPDYRSLMRAHGLGIDCSGFLYHVLSSWLRAAGKPSLPRQLVVKRDDILTAMQRQKSWQRSKVSETEVGSWPQWVSMEQVCRRFHKNARMLTAVATLVHPKVVVPVGRAKDILPGDLIKLTSAQWGDHIAIVVENNGSELIIAESTEPADKLGGVRYDQIQIQHPERGLEHQGWKRARNYHPGGSNRDGIWRLQEMTQ